MSEPHLRTVRPDDDRLGQLEERHEVFAAAIERRMAAIERWHAFVLGATAAVSALVGIGLAVASMLLK